MLNKLKRAALGAHTPHDKATAASKPVPMPLPAQVRILMSQHIGAPAKALVKKGDEVFVGTKIGEAGGLVSANIHSSVSGTVAAVEPFRLSNGRMCDSVVIKTDGKQTVDSAVKAPEVTDKASFLAAVRECGLVGLGGAGFPTDVKLQPKQTVDTLLIKVAVSFHAGWGYTMRNVVLPYALPMIFAGLRIAAGTALLLLVAAEMFAAEQGIGALILHYGDLMITERLMAGVIVLSVLGLIFNLFLQFLERKLVPWNRKE